MILKLLVLMTALVGMVSASGAGHRPLNGNGDGDAGEPMQGHGYDHGEDDPDAGWRGFGKVVYGVTVVAVIVFVIILVMMFLSLGGVWEDDLADPPV
jgi:hypothetical protein